MFLDIVAYQSKFMSEKHQKIMFFCHFFSIFWPFFMVLHTHFFSNCLTEPTIFLKTISKTDSVKHINLCIFYHFLAIFWSFLTLFLEGYSRLSGVNMVQKHVKKWGAYFVIFLSFFDIIFGHFWGFCTPFFEVSY